MLKLEGRACVQVALVLCQVTWTVCLDRESKSELEVVRYVKGF
jgi:hypothetical protein